MVHFIQYFKTKIKIVY